MYVPQLISLVLQISILSNPVSEQYQVGDMVIVIHDTDIRDGEQVVQRVHRGLPLTVETVESGRVWVSHHIEQPTYMPKGRIRSCLDD